MEFLYLSLLTLFILLVISFSLRLCIPKNKAGLVGLPPGGSGWPIIGETLQFYFAGLGGHPEKFFFDRMTKYSSTIFRSHLFGEPVVVFSGANGNKFLFSNENRLVQVRWPASMEKIYSPVEQPSFKEETDKLKKILPDFVKPEALQKYVAIMDGIANRHFASDWENKDQIKAFPACGNYTFMVASKLFVSIEYPTEVSKLSELLNIVLHGFISIPIDLPGTRFNRAIKAAGQLRKMILDMIKQRKTDLAEGKATATQDILSHMLMSINEDGKFNHEIDIANQIIGLFLAGHETLNSACGFVVKFLAELPDVYEEVYIEQMEVAKCKAPDELLNWDDIQKMKYSWNVACEAMRLFPPALGIFREALTDFTYDGLKIPKGWKLFSSTYATHRCPEYFPEPEKFDPSRFKGNGPAPFTYIPFGGGPRMCTGKEFARLAILVFMHNLVKRFRFEKMIPEEGIIVNPTPKLVKQLPVRLYPHK